MTTRIAEPKPIYKLPLPGGTRTALHRRWPKCPGCGETRGLAPHHVVPRDEGGGDDLGNLMMLCDPCHDFIEAHDYKPRTLKRILFILGDRFPSGLSPDEPEIPGEEGDWREWVYGGVPSPWRNTRWLEERYRRLGGKPGDALTREMEASVRATLRAKTSGDQVQSTMPTPPMATERINRPETNRGALQGTFALEIAP